uniref:Protein saal1 n=1 Tax=Davidia involucrata TaxID=16924 RepID=A0A5B7BF14_DAVIN
MSIPSLSAAEEEEEENQAESAAEEENQAPAHHPTAPSDELFDVSTTVDPSYIISLIRKLLPPDVRNSNNSHGGDAHYASTQGSKADGMEESVVSLAQNGVLNGPNIGIEAMDTVDDFDELAGCKGDDGSCEKRGGSAGEDTWEECGCILWDLAASKTHAEFMVQNLVTEVLLTSLVGSQSVRVTEISLGILGNLACHEVSQKHIASTNGLIEIIVDQLFLDDTQCLCEACRLLTSGLQGSECVTWAEALQPEHILRRILWIAENTLNPQLIEKSVGLLLAILESQQEVIFVLLPPLMKLGLPSLLINLLDFEMNKLTGEKIPDRYSVLDLILRTMEALSAIDDYSQEICSNKELFQLLNVLVKLPDKIEVANSCVTAAVLIANILTDAADLALEISQDLSFLQGLLDIFPFTSDDMEARSAIWSIVARLLIRVQESEMSLSSLHQYVSVLVSKSDVIEEDLIDYQLDDSNEEHENSTTSGAKLNARTTALKRIISILSQWTTLKDSVTESNFMEDNYVIDGNVDRLLECCRKYTKSDAGSCITG